MGRCSTGARPERSAVPSCDDGTPGSTGAGEESGGYGRGAGGVDAFGADESPRADRDAAAPPGPGGRGRRGAWASLDLAGLPATRAFTEALRDACDAADRPSFRQLRDRSIQARTTVLAAATLNRMLTPKIADPTMRKLPDWAYYEALLRVLHLEPGEYRGQWEEAQEEWSRRPAPARETPDEVPSQPAEETLRAQPQTEEAVAPSPRGRLRRWLLAGAVLAVVVAALSVALIWPGSKDSGQCRSDDSTFSRTYQANIVYNGNGYLHCGYSTPYSWMHAVTNLDIRGADNAGGYKTLEVLDTSTDMDLLARFHTCTTPDPSGRCPVTVSVVHQGNHQPWGAETSSRNCDATVPTPSAIEPEYAGWTRYLADVGEVERGTLKRAILTANSDSARNERCG